jgi:O-antigen ligase
MKSTSTLIHAFPLERPPIGFTALAASACALVILFILFITTVLGTPLTVVMVAVFLPVVLLCALYPMGAVCVLFALLPFDFFLSSYSNAQGSLIEFVEAAVVAGVLIALAFRRRLFQAYRYGWIVGALGLTAVVSYSISLKTHEIQVKTAETLTHCLLFFAIVALMRSEQNKDGLWRALRVPFAITVVASLYQILIWDYGFLFRLLYPQSLFLGSPFERVTGPFEHPNTNGGFAVGFFCLVGISYAIRGGTKNMALFWGLLTLTAAVVVASGSNGAAAGLACALFIYVCLFSQHKLRNLTWLFLGSAAGALALFANGGVRLEASSEGRLLIWLAGGQMFLSSPWFGRGVGSFSEWYGDYLPPDVFANHIAASAHSIYMNTLAEMGLVGFILLILILYLVCRDTIVYRHSLLTERRCVSASLLCFLAYFLVHGFVDQLTYHANYSVLFWTVIAIGSAYWERPVHSIENS